MTVLGRQVLRGALAFGSTWLVLALLAQAWLSMRVPVSATDLQDASWIVPYSRVMWPARAGAALGALALGMVGLSIVLWRRHRPGVWLALLIGVSGLASGSAAHMLRIGVATGTARVGCYVYAMRECHEMLRLPVAQTVSRYPAVGSGPHGDYATWYRLSFALLHPRAAQSSDLVVMLPGGYFLLGPLYAFDDELIARALSEQRETVAAYRRLHEPLTPTAARLF